MKGFFDSGSGNTVKKLIDLVKNESIAHDGNNDPKWAEKMVKNLAKKLKKAKSLEELEKSISNCEPLTDCVPIQRALDGSSSTTKKNHPHVQYIRMWRFPWVRTHHELKEVHNCRFPYSKKLEQVCINPFHYEPVLQTRVPQQIVSITVPKHVVMPMGVPPSLDLAATTALNGMPGTSDDSYAPSNVTFPGGDEMRDQFSPQDYWTPDGGRSLVSTPAASPTADMSMQQGYGYGQMTFPPSASASSAGSPVFGTPAGGNAGGLPYSPNSLLSEDNDERQRDMDMDMEVDDMGSPSECHGTRETEDVPYQDPEHWVSITYYEEGKRVGEAFNASRDQPYILIDGFTAPSKADRFCLGYLNNMNRSAQVLDARKHIGRGVRLYYLGGEVYCECVSETAIFVQSPNCNQRHGWHPSTVCKVPPHCNLKIFNNAEFAAALRVAAGRGFEAVYALTRMCTIRISFVKGWGADYRRQTVTATPCWVEVHLNGPLQWIDRVLKTMVPATICTSNT